MLKKGANLGANSDSMASSVCGDNEVGVSRNANRDGSRGGGGGLGVERGSYRRRVGGVECSFPLEVIR
jgi:hypothetical protein